MTHRFFFVLGVMLMLSFTSCKDDEKTFCQADSLFELPLAQLGNKLTNIEQNVSNLPDTFYDPSERKLTVKTGNSDFPEMDYCFDNHKICQFAIIRAKSYELLTSDEFASTLISKGWQEKKLPNAQPGTAKIYTKGNEQLVLLLTASSAAYQPTIIYCKNDQSSGSITRFEDNKDNNSGFWQPMTAFGMKKNIFSKYEMIYGHKPNEKRTNPKNGFFAYDTGEPKFPLVGYWYGETKKEDYLQECAIYLDYFNPPTDEEIDRYVEGLGFEKQRIYDAYNNLYYYNWDQHVACMAAIRNPKNLPPTKFNPTLRFQKRLDLEQILPKRTVDFPWIDLFNNKETAFNKGKLDDFINAFKKLGYEDKIIPGMEWLPAVEKKGADFPMITFFEGENSTCSGIFMFSAGPKVVASNNLEKQLKERGYELYTKRQVMMETYLNFKTDIQIQVDTRGAMEDAGFGYTVGINAIEDMFRNTADIVKISKAVMKVLKEEK